MVKSYKSTLYSCYLGFVTQAIIVNLAPLFFVVFQSDYGVSFEMLGRLVLANFVTQIVVDFLATRFADRMGYRVPCVAAHLCCGMGLVLLAVLPQVLPDPYVGLVIASIIYAVGGGLIEVMLSPIVENMPDSPDKAAAMSLLHSFYCWGQMAVVLITTLIVSIIGREYWYFLPIVWAILPFYNMVRFLRVPLMPTVTADEQTTLGVLFKNGGFWVAMAMMIAAGASELAMSQWASMFAEKGLGVSKTVGDLMGPCLFACFMGIGRLLYGKLGHKMDVRKVMMGCAVLGILCYALAAFQLNPVLGLVGCALCGLAVSIMWPASLSMTAARFPKGGVAMFALLAMCGDIGCSVGPWLTGIISDAVLKNGSLLAWGASIGLEAEELCLKAGLGVAIIFPLLMLVMLLIGGRQYGRAKAEK